MRASVYAKQIEIASYGRIVSMFGGCDVDFAELHRCIDR